MLERLESRMELLTGGPRDLPSRQRTLRAALDWSHELLDEPEQAALARLSVFAGGFTLEAAEAVVDPFGGLESPVMDLVEALHDQSLLLRLPGEEEPRFAMLETIREYAAERLRASGEEAATRRGHAAYFLVLAEEGEAALTTGEPAHWLERFQTEEANFRAALDWLIGTDNADWGLRMALGLFRYWEVGESVSEGRQRLDQLLALPSAQQDSQARAKALFAAGVLAANHRHFDAAGQYFKPCLDFYRRVRDRSGQAVVLNALGIRYTDQGRYEKAQACYEECMELWEELGESDGAARSLSNFAYVLRQQGELERSRQLYREAVRMFERLGDPVGAAWEVSHEADVARDQGDPDAVRLCRQALDSFRELGEPWGTASTVLDLGGLAQEAGELDEAEAHHREALGLFWRVGHQRGVARVLEALATLAAERDDDERVLWLAGAAEALRERLGRPPSDPRLEAALDDAVAGARGRLVKATADAAWLRGQQQKIARLVEEIGCEDGRAQV